MKYFRIVPGLLLLITLAKAFNTSLSLSSALSPSIRVTTKIDCSLEPPSTSERSYTRWRRYLKCSMYQTQTTPTQTVAPNLAAVPISVPGTSACSSMDGMLTKRTNVRMRRYIQCLWNPGTVGPTPTPSPTPELVCRYEPPSWSGKRALVRWRRYLVLEPNCPVGNKENSTMPVKPKCIESQAHVDLSGRKYLERLIAVYLFRSKTWIDGVPPGWPCQVNGTRCSLGYYCKCVSMYCTCRLLVFPKEIIVSDNVQKPSFFGREEGMSCSTFLMQCKMGLECRKYAENQHFCVQSTSTSSLTFSYASHQYENSTKNVAFPPKAGSDAALSYVNHQIANSTENVVIPPSADELITKPDENSHIKANEYNARGFVVYVESKTWLEGLPVGSACSEDGQRCSLGLSCRLEASGAKVCKS